MGREAAEKPPFLFPALSATMAETESPPYLQTRVPMKRKINPNKLCLSCRRHCKQAATVIISSCPRYYPGPKIKRESWKQMELDLLSLP